MKITFLALVFTYSLRFIEVQSTSLQRYCHGTSIACESDKDCKEPLSSICSFPVEWTADQAPDQTKQVKVFVMMGQSNMIGYGQVSPKETVGTLLYEISNGKYTHLVGSYDAEGNVESFSERSDVRIVFHDNGREAGNSNLKVGWDEERTDFIGPEIGFGSIIGHAYENPVLIIKVGRGGRSLGYDFLPENSTRFSEYYSFPGHGECPQRSLYNAREARDEDCNSCRDNEWRCPVFWSDKNECLRCHGNYAGLQFDRDVENVKQILNNIQEYVPGYQNQDFDLEGFLFWQGWNDRMEEEYSMKYQENLKRYIDAQINEFESYNGEKKFVVASIGFNGFQGFTPNEELVFEAQMSVDGSNLQEYEGNVTVIDTRPYWVEKRFSPSQSGHYHYNHNANTFMQVGEAMALAMIDLLPDEVASLPSISPSISSEPTLSTQPTFQPTTSQEPSLNKGCNDDEDAKFYLIGNPGKSVKCSWLSKKKARADKRIAKYCKLHRVKTICKSTCSFCTCADDDSFTFKLINSKKNKTCDWLTSSNEKKDAIRITRYCTEDFDSSAVMNACTKSCGLCQ